ncbi:MAG: hypothetical protein RL091_2972 [Verrucomicrobiota bacterium]
MASVSPLGGPHWEWSVIGAHPATDGSHREGYLFLACQASLGGA